LILIKRIQKMKIKKIEQCNQSKPFEFIKNIDPEILAQIFQMEHPQTIALVLMHLEPKKASAILKYLWQELQADVILRIACSDKVNPKIINIVEIELEKTINSLFDKESKTLDNVDSAVNILNFMNQSFAKQIMTDLNRDDPDLVEEIQKRRSCVLKRRYRMER